MVYESHKHHRCRNSISPKLYILERAFERFVDGFRMYCTDLETRLPPEGLQVPFRLRRCNSMPPILGTISATEIKFIDYMDVIDLYNYPTASGTEGRSVLGCTP